MNRYGSHGEGYVVNRPLRRGVEHTAAVRYVNVYEETREYGGPEEGGWYYTVGEVVESVKVPRNADVHVVEKIVARLRETHIGDDRRNNWSRSHFRVVVEGHPARPYPAQTPHYE